MRLFTFLFGSKNLTPLDHAEQAIKAGDYDALSATANTLLIQLREPHTGHLVESVVRIGIELSKSPKHIRQAFHTIEKASEKLPAENPVKILAAEGVATFASQLNNDDRIKASCFILKNLHSDAYQWQDAGRYLLRNKKGLTPQKRIKIAKIIASHPKHTDLLVQKALKQILIDAKELSPKEQINVYMFDGLYALATSDHAKQAITELYSLTQSTCDTQTKSKIFKHIILKAPEENTHHDLSSMKLIDIAKESTNTKSSLILLKCVVQTNKKESALSLSALATIKEQTKGRLPPAAKIERYRFIIENTEKNCHLRYDLLDGILEVAQQLNNKDKIAILTLVKDNTLHSQDPNNKAIKMLQTAQEVDNIPITTPKRAHRFVQNLIKRGYGLS